jgi:hypothetical protein
MRVPNARLAAACILALLFAIEPGMVRADTNSHGGIVSAYTANSRAGTITVTVTNPFSIPVSGSVNWSTSTQSGTVNFNSVPAYGSVTVTVTSSSGFGSSTAGAQVSDSTGTNSATGWGMSSANSCTTCDDTY